MINSKRRRTVDVLVESNKNSGIIRTERIQWAAEQEEVKNSFEMLNLRLCKRIMEEKERQGGGKKNSGERGEHLIQDEGGENGKSKVL